MDWSEPDVFLYWAVSPVLLHPVPDNDPQVLSSAVNQAAIATELDLLVVTPDIVFVNGVDPAVNVPMEASNSTDQYLLVSVGLKTSITMEVHVPDEKSNLGFAAHVPLYLHQKYWEDIVEPFPLFIPLNQTCPPVIPFDMVAVPLCCINTKHRSPTFMFGGGVIVFCVAVFVAEELSAGITTSAKKVMAIHD